MERIQWSPLPRPHFTFKSMNQCRLLMLCRVHLVRSRRCGTLNALRAAPPRLPQWTTTIYLIRPIYQASARQTLGTRRHSRYLSPLAHRSPIRTPARHLRRRLRAAHHLLHSSNLWIFLRTWRPGRPVRLLLIPRSKASDLVGPTRLFHRP